MEKMRKIAVHACKVFLTINGFFFFVCRFSYFKDFFFKQLSRSVPKKMCSKNMQQMYRRISIPKCDFNKIASELYGCSPVYLLHIFRTPVPKNSYGWLLPFLFLVSLINEIN